MRRFFQSFHPWLKIRDLSLRQMVKGGQTVADIDESKSQKAGRIYGDEEQLKGDTARDTPADSRDRK